jgi:hypothetical protein
MRRWQEVKEDYPFMASEREHAQSEFTCIASRRKCVNIFSDIVLIVSIVSGKKSFGAITICIHPLMYKKPCREQYSSKGSLAHLMYFAQKYFQIFKLFMELFVFIINSLAKNTPGSQLESLS